MRLPSLVRERVCPQAVMAADTFSLHSVSVQWVES
jgi:hypothetical protein